jgi:integrase/recombinase XerC
MKNEIMNIDSKLSIKDYKEEFLKFVDVSNFTLESYSSGIKQFIKYLDKKGISVPEREDVIAFRDEEKELNSVATANSYLSSLRAFFQYLEYNGIYKNITLNVKSLKDTTIHKRKFLTVETCKELLNNCKDLREKVLFSLTLECGLRANEVCNIRLEDFKTIDDKICLYVLGKARDYKQDYVIVDNQLYELIKKYIVEYNIKDYLFVSTSNNNTGGKLTTTSLRRIINALYERLGIKDEQTTFHSIRHSFATISISNGADIREVSKAMRHSSTSITERYLHDLEMINNQCSNIVSSQVFGGALNG